MKAFFGILIKILKTLKKMQRIKHLLMFLIGIFILYACEYDFIEPPIPVPPDPTDTISFSTEVAPIFGEQGCLACHGGTISPDLSPANAYLSIINNSLVDLDNPAQSIIYTKPIPGGSHSGTYTPDQSAVVLVWIEQGANDN